MPSQAWGFFCVEFACFARVRPGSLGATTTSSHSPNSCTSGKLGTEMIKSIQILSSKLAICA